MKIFKGTDNNFILPHNVAVVLIKVQLFYIC